MDSFADLLDKLSDDLGRARLANALGTTESHLRVMKARNSIPTEYWPLLIKCAPRAMRSELTISKLTELRVTGRAKKREAN